MTLISSITEFKQYIAIDGNMKWESLLPYVREAEQLYIKPLLGASFYNEYLALYADAMGGGDALSEENANLLPYIQRPLAYYAQLKAIPHLTVTFGDMGVREHVGEDSHPAPRWKEEKLMLNALIQGDTHAEALLTYLEENATDDNDYATWYTTANTAASGIIVYSTEIASRYIDISNSRRVFLALLPTIKQLEQRWLPRLISEAQYAELVDEIKTNTISPNNAELLIRIQPVIARRALHMRLPFMRVSIAPDGLWLYSDVKEIRGKDFLATKEDLKALMAELKDGLLGYEADEEELRQFILDNIDDYPLIKASPVYTVQPTPGPTWQPVNDPFNKHFSV